MRLGAPADAHPSLHRFARRIVEADKEARTTPLKFQTFAAAADLPPAADWSGGAVFVTALVAGPVAVYLTPGLW